jgi:hypothetical protein
MADYEELRAKNKALRQYLKEETSKNDHLQHEL